MDYIKACSVYQNELSRRLVLITLIYYKLVTAVSVSVLYQHARKSASYT